MGWGRSLEEALAWGRASALLARTTGMGGASCLRALAWTTGASSQSESSSETISMTGRGRAGGWSLRSVAGTGG